MSATEPFDRDSRKYQLRWITLAVLSLSLATSSSSRGSC